MEDFEFKGGNQYSQEVLADVARDLRKAIKILGDIDCNFHFVKDLELENVVVEKCKEMLCVVLDNLYVKNDK